MKKFLVVSSVCAAICLTALMATGWVVVGSTGESLAGGRARVAYGDIGRGGTVVGDSGRARLAVGHSPQDSYFNTMPGELVSSSPAPAPVSLPGAGQLKFAELLARYDQTRDPALIAEIDQAANQRDASVSRLYWHTDLAQALVQAKAEQKPVLYLRLLGKLTDEYSCANSRFFRTVLYADPMVSKLLAERFVLVWESERPAPLVTIDFGDGRQMKRTLTGNSIHYVLDADGYVVDALPGLYSPQIFAGVLSRVGNMRNNGLSGATYQQQELDRLVRAWRVDSPGAAALVNANNQGNDRPRAKVEPRVLRPANEAPRAMAVAITKRMGEAPLLEAISPQFRQEMATAAREADDQTWERKASRLGFKLSAPSTGLVKRDLTPADGTWLAQDVLDETVKNLEKTVAIDTARNEFLLRQQILSWLIESTQPVPVERLNQRVYAELFLTPADDRWLGLLPQATYTGLLADGVMAGR